MPADTHHDPLCNALTALDPRNSEYATRFVELVLQAACARQASDVHLQPTAAGLLLRWRLDGVLHELGRFPSGEAADVVSRLKVLAELLTYRHDVPQEGRIRRVPQDIEMRVSTFPTLHGERAVVRLFATQRRLLYPEDLGFPADLAEALLRLVSESSGAVLITGPAGSGKTTTAYALLRHLARHSAGQKSLVSLEDPIEAAVEGVAQSQIQPGAGFDFATGLRSLMRQDPEVVLVGEIRDRLTAETAYQAALTGHLVLTTFHAGSAAGAVSRLTDMGIEPYLLRSGTLGILSQRLVRRLCDCARPSEDPADRLGLPVRQCRVAVGCPQCGRTGYRGRQLLAELLPITPDAVGRAILSRLDTAQIEGLAVQAGMVTRWERTVQAVEAGVTSPAEIRRVLGFGDSRASAAQ
jgi:type II secretory ATPase GspE/PulE/Tfp pilus assembly ATPase PilB-like protein